MNVWYEIQNPEEVITPALLFYPDRIQENIEQMIVIAGSAARLRPHIKTYKCREIVQMQMENGIGKFKCATISEALMLAEMGVDDILIAYPLIGPAQKKLLQLKEAFPKTTFSCLIDHPHQVEQWKQEGHQKINVFIDLNVGMKRTGISPADAFSLLEMLDDAFEFQGWHIYDGHIRTEKPEERAEEVARGFASVIELFDKLDRKQKGEVVCGGSITFPIHAQYPDRHLSPGTTLLWDQGYAQRFPDLNFNIAATIMTRVISKPDQNKICLDSGHKAVASEMKTSPIFFPQLPEIQITTLSEEHMVIESTLADNWNVGDVLYAYPTHICPTVALHEYALVVKNQKISESWQIEARKRIYQ